MTNKLAGVKMLQLSRSEDSNTILLIRILHRATKIENTVKKKKEKRDRALQNTW